VIRVLLADDHVLVREGLVRLLSEAPDIAVVASVSDGEQAFEGIQTLRPDVAVVDIVMPGMTGVEVARKARDEGLMTAVVVLSMHREPALVSLALDAGVSGYVLKEVAAEELLRAVRLAAGGGVYLCRRVEELAIDLRRNGGAFEPEKLTPRERDVLRLLARGLSCKEIAAELAVAPRTIEYHRSNIMDKLGIRHIPGLVKYAIRHGLASIDD